jgi:hypothetical protein
MTNDAPLQYKEADDPVLFAKYVELRHRAFLNQYEWLPGDFGFAEETDRASRIMVAMRDGVVVGGGRLTISRPESPRILPLEETGFRLRDCGFLKEFHLDRLPCGEISRMAADHGCGRGFEISAGVGNALCAIAAAEGLDIVFSICPELPARINQRNARRRGVEFHKYIELPTAFGVNMWLCAFTGLLRVYGRWEKEAA